MTILSPFIESEHHREAAAALLHFVLPHGERGAFARKVGISPQHLSQITTFDSPAHQPARRTPSPELIARIVASLPAPADVRESLRQHLMGSRTTLDRGQRVLRVRTGPELSHAVQRLRTAHHLATHAPDGAAARRLYRGIVTAAYTLIEQIDGNEQPIEKIEVLLCLHDALCVLDDSASALFHALSACSLIELLPDRPDWRRSERLGELTVNARRAAGVAYCNLRRLRAAQLSFQQAKHLQAARDRAATWAPHLCRDQLTVLYKAPWLTLKAADRLVSEAESVTRNDIPVVSRFLMDLKRADCFTAFGSVREARRQLDGISLAVLGDTLGPLHRAIHLTSHLKLAVRTGDSNGAMQWGHQALQIACEAGLIRQARSVARLMKQAGACDELWLPTDAPTMLGTDMD